MLQRVLLQLPHCPKRLRALCAEQPLLRMDIHVLLQGATLSERLAALEALMRSLSRMQQHVDLQGFAG